MVQLNRINFKAIRDVLVEISIKTFVTMLTLNVVIRYRFPEVPELAFGEVFSIIFLWLVLFSSRHKFYDMDLRLWAINQQTDAMLKLHASYYQTKMSIDAATAAHNDAMRAAMLLNIPVKKTLPKETPPDDSTV